MSDQPKIGPTGDYDLGAPIHSGDRGGLNVAVGVLEGYIIMHFGTHLDWLATPPESAVVMATKIGQLALKASNGNLNFDQLELETYGDSDKPLEGGIDVSINHEKKVIETKLPQSVEFLAFDPQGAFAYGVRLMMCVKVLRPDLVPYLPNPPGM